MEIPELEVLRKITEIERIIFKKILSKVKFP